jgi:hypothetical protein
MAKTPREIAQDLQARLHQSGSPPVVTIPWEKMYIICGRERIRQALMSSIERELRKMFILIKYGVNVVVVCPDTNFKEIQNN